MLGSVSKGRKRMRPRPIPHRNPRSGLQFRRSNPAFFAQTDPQLSDFERSITNAWPNVDKVYVAFICLLDTFGRDNDFDFKVDAWNAMKKCAGSAQAIQLLRKKLAA